MPHSFCAIFFFITEAVIIFLKFKCIFFALETQRIIFISDCFYCESDIQIKSVNCNYVSPI